MVVHLWDNWTYGAVRSSPVQLGQDWYLYCADWLICYRSCVKKVMAEKYIHPAFSYTFEGHGQVFGETQENTCIPIAVMAYVGFLGHLCVWSVKQRCSTLFDAPAKLL